MAKDDPVKQQRELNALRSEAINLERQYNGLKGSITKNSKIEKDLAAQIWQDVDKRQKSMRKYNDEQKKVLQGTVGLSKLEKDIVKNKIAAQKYDGQKLKNVNMVLRAQERSRLVGINTAKNMSDIGKEGYKAISTESAREKIMQQRADLENTYGKSSLKNLNSIGGLVAAQLDKEEKRLDTIDSQNDLATEQHNKIKEGTDLIMGGLESWKSKLEAFPGGKFIARQMGLADEQMAKIAEGVTNQLIAMVVHGQSLKTTMIGVKASMAGVNFAMLGIIGLFVAAAALLVNISGKIDAIGDKFGALGVQQFQKDILAADAEMKKFGYDAGVASDIANEMANNYGMAFDEALKIGPKVGEMSKALGISTEEGSKLVGMFTTMAGHSAETAINLAKQAESLAVAEGVAPGAVMKDVAENTEMFAKYAKDGGKNILKTAIQAKKLGINLKAVDKIMSGLLDFETSIEKEMEASVLLGKQLNYQRARELALAGDQEGAMKNILSQIGGEAEWNKMNVIQRQALADSIGVGTDEMAKMITNQKKATKEGGKLEDQKVDEIVAKEAMSNLNEMLLSLKSIGATITNVLGPPLNFIFGIFNQIGKVIGWVIGLFSKYSGVVKTLAAVLTVLFLPQLVNMIKYMGISAKAKIKDIALSVRGRFVKMQEAMATRLQTTATSQGIIQTNIATMQGWANVAMTQAKTMWTNMMTGAQNLMNMAKQTQIALSIKNAAVMAKEGIKAAFMAGKNAVAAVSGFFRAAAAGAATTLGFGTPALVALAVAGAVALFAMMAKAPKLEAGGSVKNTGMAEVHAGEKVLDKDTAKAIGDGDGSPGGVNMTPVVNAIQTLQSSVESMKSELAAKLGELPKDMGRETTTAMEESAT